MTISVGLDRARMAGDWIVLSRLVDVVICPCCGSSLSSLPGAGVAANVVVRCGSCGRSTTVVDGVWDALTPTGERPVRTPAQLTNVVPLVARGYEPMWRRRSLTLLTGRSFPNDDELDEMVAAARPFQHSVYVDVACSEGLYARRLAAEGATVVAVDHSVPPLRRLTRHRLPSVLAVRALAQRLPLADASVDGAVIGGSLNEIGDLAGALREARRVTRPGGRMFSMSLIAATSGGGRLLQGLARPSGIVFPTEAETVAMFEAAGWSVESTALDRVVLRITARTG